MFTLELNKIEDGIGADIVNIDITQPLTDEMQNGLRQAWENFSFYVFADNP
jgi:hypothetical protein